MTARTIAFPHLGITLKNVGDHISIFGFDIAYYGIIIGLGILLGLAIAVTEAKRTKQNVENYFDLVIFGVIFGIIGARIYYIIFSWQAYKDNLLDIFNIREGGLAIYGGIIAAVLTVLIYSHVKKLKTPLVLDTVSFGLVTGQMIGRWGNFFNREVFGEYTNNVLAMRLPLSAVRSSDVSDKMMDHLKTIDGIEFIQVHPTFLYESLWCLGVLILLLCYRKYKKFDGELFLMYLTGYGLGRFWIEGIRTDQLYLPGTQLPVSQLLAGATVLVCAGIWIWQRVKVRQKSISDR